MIATVPREEHTYNPSYKGSSKRGKSPRGQSNIELETSTVMRRRGRGRKKQRLRRPQHRTARCTQSGGSTRGGGGGDVRQGAAVAGGGVVHGRQPRGPHAAPRLLLRLPMHGRERAAHRLLPLLLLLLALRPADTQHVCVREFPCHLLSIRV